MGAKFFHSSVFCIVTALLAAKIFGSPLDAVRFQETTAEGIPI